MTDLSSGGKFAGSPSVDVQNVFDEYEAAWTAGRRILIEKHLADYPEPYHSTLLRALVLLELSYRAQRGEQFTLAEYIDRFPNHSDFLEAAFANKRPAQSVVKAPEAGAAKRSIATDSTITYGGEVVADTQVAPRDAGAPQTRTTHGDIGDYSLLGEIGRGGMGVVYRARQKSADRMVALKVIRPERLEGLTERDRNDAIQRFQTEARAAARLDHDHLVTVYDVGEVDGQHYYSMRLVQGLSLSQLLREGPLENRRAARYIESVSQAVHEAHRNGILHRDLKPSNILVDTQSDRAMVADFGLAKLMEEGRDFTVTGQVFGSPPYMSPEQSLDSAKAKETADVYGLGATLYHLLTGRPPFQAATNLETLRQVLDQLPIPPRDLNPAIDRDLDTVCLKCLEKEPRRRYASASELADDLRRYRNLEPIAARPLSRLQRTFRWCKREPMTAGLVATACLLLLVFVAAYFRESHLRYDLQAALHSESKALSEVTAARTEAEAKRQLAEQQTRVLLSQRLSDQAHGLVKTKPECSLLLASEAVEMSLREGVPIEPVAEQALSHVVMNASRHPISKPGIISRDGSWMVSISDTNKNGIAGLWNLRDNPLNPTVKVIEGEQRHFTAAKLSPDSRWLAVAFEGGDVWLWDLHRGEPTKKFVLKAHQYPLTTCVFSPDNRWLATGTRDWRSRDRIVEPVRLWNLAADHPDNVPLVLETPRGPVGRVIFSADGQWMAGEVPTPLSNDPSDPESVAILWRLSESTEDATPIVLGDASVVTFSPKSDWLLTKRDSRVMTEAPTMIQLWNLTTTSAGKSPTTANLGLKASVDRAITFSPDGHWLTATRFHEQSQQPGHVVLLWELSRAGLSAEPISISVPEGRDSDRIFSPDGRWLAVAGTNPLARRASRLLIWDLQSSPPANQAVEIRVGDRPFEHAFFTPDARWLIGIVRRNTRVRSERLSAHAWEIANDQAFQNHVALDATFGEIDCMSISPNGERLIATSVDGTARTWNLNDQLTEQPSASLAGLSQFPPATRFSPDGSRFVMVGASAKVCDVTVGPTDAQLRSLPGSTVFNAEKIEFSNDSRWLMRANYECLLLHDMRANSSEKEQVRIHAVADWATAIAMSPDGQRVATGSRDGKVQVIELGSGNHEPPSTHRQCTPNTRVTAIAFSADGRWLAAGDSGGLTKLWDISTPNRSPISLTNLPGEVFKIDFADGLLVLTLRTSDSVAIFPIPDQIEDASEQQATLLPVKRGFRLLPQGWAFGPGWTVSSGGRWLARWGFDDGKIRLLDLNNADQSTNPPEITIEAHSETVEYVTFSNTARWMATVGADQTIRLWNLDANKVQDAYTDIPCHGTTRPLVAFGGDDRWLVTAAGGENSLHVWNLLAENIPAQPIVWQGHQRPISGLQTSHDAAWLLSYGQPPGSPGAEVRLWDMRGSTDTTNSHASGTDLGPIVAYAFDPSGRWLATGDAEGVSRFWDLTRLQAVPIELAGERTNFWNLEASPSGEWLITSFQRLGRNTVDETPNTFLQRMSAITETPEKLARIARDMAGRDFTDEERDEYLTPISAGSTQ